MYNYRLYKERVASSVRLGDLPLRNKIKPTLTISRLRKKIPERDLNWYHHGRDNNGHRFCSFAHWKDNYYLRVNDTCDFLVSKDGKKIQYYGNPDPHHLQAQLLSTILPLAVLLRGYHVFHSSSVVMSNGVIAMLGKQGLGKSTLAAAFIQNNFKIFSDDSLPMRKKKKKFLVYPSFPEVRLSKHGLKYFFGQEKVKKSVRAYRKKRALFLDHFGSKALPLKAIFHLRRTDRNRISIQPMRAQEAWTMLLENSYRIDPWNRSQIQKEAKLMAELVSCIPAFSLTYPRNHQALQRVIRKIQSKVDKL